MQARSPLAVIFITIFIDLLGFGLVLPALPFYAESYGATPIMVGLLTMSYSLMQFLFAPLWGRISDRVGRRPVILLGLAGSCVSFLLFGLSRSLTMLFVARSLAGVLTSASLPTAQAFIADTTTPENRARGMGLIGAAFGLGFIFGPSMGGLLTKWGYPVPSYVAAALAGLNFLWALLVLPETLHFSKRKVDRRYLSPARLKETFSDPRLAFLLSIFFVSVFAFANMESTFALFGEHQIGLNAFGVGALLAEVGVIAAVVQGLLIGRLTKKFGEARLAIWGVFLMGTGFALTVLVHHMLGMALVVPLYALGSALLNPSIMSLISRSVTDNQGSTLGVAQGIAAFSRILGPLWGTWVFQIFEPDAPFISGAILLGLVWLATVWRLRRVTAPVIEPIVPV